MGKSLQPLSRAGQILMQTCGSGLEGFGALFFSTAVGQGLKVENLYGYGQDLDPALGAYEFRTSALNLQWDGLVIDSDENGTHGFTAQRAGDPDTYNKQ